MKDEWGGIDPPSHSLLPPNPPSFTRSCIECGKLHDTGLQNMKTGAMIERFDKCYDCLMSNAYTINPINTQITLESLNDSFDNFRDRLNKNILSLNSAPTDGDHVGSTPPRDQEVKK